MLQVGEVGEGAGAEAVVAGARLRAAEAVLQVHTGRVTWARTS